MIRRVALLCSLAVAGAIALGVAAWLLHLHALRTTIAAQAASARVLLAAGIRPDAAAVHSLLRPGLHVVVLDRRDNVVIDAMGDRTRVRGLPAGPPAGLPGAPPRRGAPPFLGLALDIAHIRPTTIGRVGAIVTIAPAAPALARFLAWDIALTLLVVAMVVTLGFMRTNEIAREERIALIVRADERRDEAEKYQRFLAEAGHELRTPLTIVSGYIDILSEAKIADSLDPRVVSGLQAETARMRHLVEKMLSLARLESSASIPRLLDLTTACADIVATMQRRYPQRTLKVTGDPGVRIVIDADDFFDALGNLIENAIHYAPGSPIEINNVVHDAVAQIRVIDCGPGVPLEEQASIFERFRRGSGNAKPEGLGLGLAIVKRVVERWEGRVELESTPGQTVFALSFPVADEELNGSSR
ncbi:MAG TPA: HAMP domain-containing sensor histidine kinase [Candidatus Dormibacteraeota bacterium]|nr:HAMP domain-containing sensor histidine kinase [Candidatus Dormibacteraeota bacterium]